MSKGKFKKMICIVERGLVVMNSETKGHTSMKISVINKL
jgi:hypothetical protein